MPDGLPSREQLVFLSLRCLYYQCRAGLISRETGAAEKKKLIRAFEELKRTEEFQFHLAAHCSELRKSVEQASSAYQKERTLENADKMLEAICGLNVSSSPAISVGAGGG